jgi:ketosteroid isomerase-like protein
LIAKKLEDACNKNDAAAVATIFTEDAVQVHRKDCFPVGTQSGKGMQTYSSERITNYISKRDQVNAIGNEAWAVGEWSCNVQSQTGPVQVKGYDSGIYVRDGDMGRSPCTFNVAPQPAETESATTSPTTTPSNQ